MGEELNFDSVELIEIPVTIAGTRYALREANGSTATQYQDAMLKCATLGEDGKPVRIEGMGVIDPKLVSMCLFDAEGKSVPKAVIQGWPSRIQRQLAKKARKISELDEGDETLESLTEQQKKIAEKIAKLSKGSSAKNELKA